VGDGTHTIEILVEDEAGNTGNALTTVVVDNTDPTVSIISPESNDVVRGILNVTFVTWDNNLSNASIIIDSDEPKNVTGATSFALNTTRLNDGTHTIKLLASDSAGNEAETSVTITVDNTIPTAEITNPTDGTELNGTITIQFSASDDNLYEVLLYVDQAMYNVTEENSYTWDTTTIGDGSHTIRLVATDQAENQVQDQITITTTNIEKTTQESYETGYLSGRNFGLEIGAPLGIIIGTIIAYAIAKKTKQGKKQT
ncbi:MAG: Ig-like domain-containing protein, partial [Thermoproteota archaeon]|nr:Ig-like domain-containing protein [Thermoproteota archaeon]